MRIIAGECRGRSLLAPPGQVTRPTADRVRQALFDTLAHASWAGADRLRGAHVLDGFAGTGALGLEALSRGAASALFVEQNRAALRCLRDNVRGCGVQDRATIRACDMLRLPSRGTAASADLVFLDPPYQPVGLGILRLITPRLTRLMLPEAVPFFCSCMRERRGSIQS